MSRGRAQTTTLAEGQYGGTVRRTVLPGGLRVVTESMPTQRSVSFGIWVGIGSRDESTALAGSSHFLEHLLFKGTRRRSALDISAELEAVGGESNAFTGKEYTCYYARVLDDDLPLAIDVVCDMLTSSLITPEDVETERGVILEEIAMHDDDPGDVVHDVFSEAVFGAHPLGRPVIGTPQTITEMSRKQIHSFYKRRYTPDTMVIAAAGNLDHQHVVRLVRKAFEPLLDGDAAVREPRGSKPAALESVPLRVVDKDTEQAHIVLGTVGIHRNDERRFALGVLNQALGGGMSSRLFQEVRERRGLAYSVYSYASQYADTGVFGVYAGCARGRVKDVLGIVSDELTEVAAKGLTDDEVRRAKGMLKGSTVLGLEDTGSRMSRIGKSELVYGDFLSVDGLLGRIDAVTPEQVRSIASEILDRPMSLGVIGPVGDQDFADVGVRR
ncbi:M16 family metallopeptidase [Fodinicola acaciae]|uniref:M16 family metallopeptidase n=1 Tax=Fodinicola acaciae TaxID=2681555 RepID=UPI0013D76E61|nr:pitrilysin family protein [Fodinicola acaciae]